MALDHGFIVPSEEFARLDLREVITLGDVEDRDCKTTPADKVYEVMMGEVHGRPPYPHYVCAEQHASAGE